MSNFEKPRAIGYTYPTLQSTTEFKRFNDDYFSGADVRLYFGDTWVDEVTSLQFTMQENVQPIYGYASYTWDKVARGTRLIQGSFSINFKENFYLHSVLNSLQSRLKAKESDGSAIFSEETFKKGVTVEHLVEQSHSRSFGAVADELEKSFWGKSGTSSIQNTTNRRPRDTYFYPEHLDGKDDSGANIYASTSQRHLRDNGFNILVTYGPYNEKDGIKVAGSAVSLMGVQLTSVSQVIGGDGSPIQEVYEFIAKDLNGNLTK